MPCYTTAWAGIVVSEAFINSYYCTKDNTRPATNVRAEFLRNMPQGPGAYTTNFGGYGYYFVEIFP